MQKRHAGNSTGELRGDGVFTQLARRHGERRSADNDLDLEAALSRRSGTR